MADAVAALPARFQREVAGRRLQIRDIPPPPLVDVHGDVLLAEFDGEVLTVYRRPVEGRAESRGSLEELVMIAVGQAVARHFGWQLGPEDLFGD